MLYKYWNYLLLFDCQSHQWSTSPNLPMIYPVWLFICLFIIFLINYFVYYFIFILLYYYKSLRFMSKLNCGNLPSGLVTWPKLGKVGTTQDTTKLTTIFRMPQVWHFRAKIRLFCNIDRFPALFSIGHLNPLFLKVKL